MPKRKEDGSTGPHPKAGTLPTYTLIIRATTMPSLEARRQAYQELTRRGCWLAKEQHEQADRLGGL